MIDIALLKILKYREDFLRISPTLPIDALDPQTVALATDFGRFFKTFPDDKIDFDLFIPRLKVWHKGIKNEQLEALTTILRQVQDDVDAETKHGVLADMHELAFGTQIANICEQYVSGDLEYPLAELVTAKLDAYKIQMGVKLVHWDDTPIADLLQADVDDSGLKWRLDVLNQHMRPLRPGDFGIIAARPDKGKTTFLASEVTHMASQLPDDKNVIWLNNESTSGNIKKRVYQAAVGKTIADMLEDSRKGTLQQQYDSVVGRADRIRIIDVHGYHVGQIEAILENNSPGLIIYDMIDNIRGFGNESRDDLKLEKMYQWARERCVKYSSAALATSQISFDGDGEQYPSLGCLKDSKTGKQGACDFQLMIGAVNAANFDFVRYLSLPKNKLRKYGAGGSLQSEVKYLPQIGRYVDIPADSTNAGNSLGILQEVI